MAGGAADGHVVIDTRLNNKGFMKGIGAMRGQVGGLQSAVSRLGAVIGTVFAVKAIADFGREAVRIGSDIAEVRNVVDVAFGDLTDKAEEFASTAVTRFGMSQLAAKKTASTYMAMAKGMGVASNEAAGMAITLAGLSGDVASFFNISQELADVKLKSVFTGETETLKDLGVVMTQDNLKAYALSKGFKKSYDSMSQAEKVGLRYRFVLDSLALANGDFARTQDSWANQTRILSMQWQQFMGILGQSIITVLKPVVKWLNAVVSQMIVLVSMFNSAVTRVFGGEKKQTAQAEATSAAIGSSVEEQEALTDAVEGTSKAQQQSLAGFDEINRLAGETAGGGGGAGAGTDIGAMDIPELMEVPELESPMFSSWGEAFSAFLDAVTDKGIPRLQAGFERFAEWLNGFTGRLYEALTFPGIAEKMAAAGNDLAQTVNSLVEQINWYQLGQALGAGLNMALLFLVNYLYGFDWIGLGNSLAAAVNGAVAEIDWYEVGRFLCRGIKTALELAAGFILGLDMPQLARAASRLAIGFFNSLSDTLAGIDWAGIGAQVAEFLNHVDWVGVITAISGALGELAGAGLEAIGGFISNADPETLLIAAAFLGAKLFGGLASKVLPALGKEIGEKLIGEIAGAVAGGDIGGLLASLGSALSSVASSISGIVSAAAPIAAVVGGAITAVLNFFEMLSNGFNWLNEILMLAGIAITAVGAVILGAPALVAGVIAAIVAAIATLAVLVKEHWEEIKQFFIDMWRGIQEIAGTIAGWFSGHVIQPVQSFFTELWQSLQKLAAGAWAAIQGIWNVVSGWFNTAVIQPVARFFAGLWNGIRQAAGAVWEAVKGVWSAAAGWFAQHVTQPLKDAFDGVKTFVTGVFNGLISGVEGMVNCVIKAINWLVSQINKISFDVPDWVPGIGGNTFGFHLPKIAETKLPRLAQGAVIPPNREFLAVLGDQSGGNNLEAPEALIRKIVREESRGGGDCTALLQAILEAVRAGNVIVMDGKALTKGVVRHMNTMTRQSGRSVVLG